MLKYNSIIIGAGAAGLMCAQTLGNLGKKVLLLEHSNKLAEKIRISGGGRCNFTNINAHPNCYISANPNFCISALSRYRPEHFTELLDSYNISYHEKTLGQLFCDNSAEDIINLLDLLCRDGQVMRKMNVIVNTIDKVGSSFVVDSSIGKYMSETLVIATGGLSIPQIGATGFGYNIAKQFDLNIIETKPALVPLALNPDDLKYFSSLSGSSFFSKTQINKIAFEENTLITHRGLSGPAILQISSYFDGKSKLTIDMLPQVNLAQLIKSSQNSSKLLATFLNQFFTKRLSDSICEMLNLNKPLNQLSSHEINQTHEFIHNFNVLPSGTLGYKKAEVTRGGVDTNELSSKDMQSKKVEGLFFIGEVVDVTGWLGGYNFQWAWASAHACASLI